MSEPSRAVREMQFRKIKADPASYYAKPEDVISDDRFENEQKLGILSQWGKDLLRLDPDLAAAQNPMSEKPMKSLARAIEELGADPGKILNTDT